MGAEDRGGHAWACLFTDPRDAAFWIEAGDRPPLFAEMRIAGIIGLVIVAVSFPSLGSNRFLLAGLLLGFTAPATWLVEHHTPAHRTDRIHTWHDTLSVVISAFLIPAIWIPALIVGVMVIVAAAASTRLFEYLGLAIFLVAAMTAMAAVHDQSNAALPLLTALVCFLPIGGHGRWYQRRFKIAAGRMGMLIESTPAVFFELSIDRLEVISVHGSVGAVLGHQQSEIVGSHLVDHVDPVDHHLVGGLASQPETSVTLRAIHPSGETRWLRFEGRRIMRGPRPAIAAVVVNVTALEESKAELQVRAERDALTGLNNRDVITDMLAADLEARPTQVAMAILDLNDFKRVNDTLGHPAGDLLLRALGNRLRTLTNDDVCIGRLGGDEFGILVRGESPRQATLRLGEEVLSRIAEPLTVDAIELQLTGSIGIAIGSVGVSAVDMLRDADIAMYQAKRDRSGIKVFSRRPDDLTATQLSIASRLNRTLEDELQLWFQPIIDLKTGAAVAVEGLARWHHPELGLLEPGSFLQSAIQSGLSERLDWLVLRSAADFAEVTAAAGFPIEVSVNLSAAGLRSPQLMPYLRSLVRRDVDLSRLTVEVSERDIHDELAAVRPTLTLLRDMEIGLSLDDYGTGFSSLLRLRDMPFTEVKIDRSFVSRSIDDPVDAAIVRSTVSLATDLGLRTVAEGVELDEVTQFLRDVGCERAQGFVFALPEPPELVVERLGELAGGDSSAAAATRVGDQDPQLRR